MSDIIGVITSVEDDFYGEKDFKKVTLGTGQVLKVKHGREDVLKKKWGLLEVGKAIKFTMQDYTKTDGVKIPFVADIETVESQLPPPKEPEPLLEEHQEVIEKVVGEATPVKEPAPQAVGMITNNITNMIIAGVNSGKGANAIMKAVFGEETSIELVRWWRGQFLGITKVQFDGAKLPDFHKKHEA